MQRVPSTARLDDYKRAALSRNTGRARVPEEHGELENERKEASFEIKERGVKGSEALENSRLR